ncbi:MAG: hypothetical protein MZV65_20645 [Chromatiales bacterium]|nr:hypothetical protein [Chromatiales bacterium]
MVEVTVGAGRVVPRPHDRAGRGRQAPEDAQRDRARPSCSSALTLDLPARGRRRCCPFARLRRRRRSSPCRSLVALLVCLIPTTIGGLLSAIGIAGMDRVMRAQRPRHVGQGGGGRRRRRRPAARQDRHHHARQPPGGRLPPGARRRRARSSPTPRSWPRSPTRRPRGARIVVLAKERFGLRGRELAGAARAFVPFTRADAHVAASTSRRPAASARAPPTPSAAASTARGGRCPPRWSRRWSARDRRAAAARRWWSPTAARVLGVDPPQGRRQGRHQGAVRRSCARMGIRTVHDHRRQPADRGGHRRRGRASTTSSPRPRRRTSCALHPRASRPQGTPGGHDRRRHQRRARRWPRPTSGVAMNTGTQAAKEAGNMVDLDSQPDQAASRSSRSASSC